MSEYGDILAGGIMLSLASFRILSQIPSSIFLSLSIGVGFLAAKKECIDYLFPSIFDTLYVIEFLAKEANMKKTGWISVWMTGRSRPTPLARSFSSGGWAWSHE